MLGLMAMMAYHARKLSDFVKENIGFTIIMNENIPESEILAFKAKLDSKSFIKSSQYITKEQAAAKMKQELGEDFVGFIGYNPLPPTIIIHFFADYTSEESLLKIEKETRNSELVKDVDYQKSMVSLINNNITKISFGILGFAGLLLIISIILIYNTIRLAIYSKRMLIKSMLLVGATQSFIRRPFIITGIWQGIFGGGIAIFLLSGALVFIHQKLPELAVLQDSWFVAVLFFVVLTFGIFLTWFCNFFAVKKYLNINSDELY
jgi:cell division transport system permease protein